MQKFSIQLLPTEVFYQLVLKTQKISSMKTDEGTGHCFAQRPRGEIDPPQNACAVHAFHGPVAPRTLSHGNRRSAPMR